MWLPTPQWCLLLWPLPPNKCINYPGSVAGWLGRVFLCVVIGHQLSWMKRRRNVQAGGSCVGRRRERPTHSNTTAGRAAVVVTHRLSVDQRRLALSRSSVSESEWGWCCFVAPGRTNAWERRKVRSCRVFGAAGCVRRQRRVLRRSKHRGCSKETGRKQKLVAIFLTLGVVQCQSYTDEGVASVYLQGVSGWMCCCWSHVFFRS